MDKLVWSMGNVIKTPTDKLCSDSLQSQELMYRYGRPCAESLMHPIIDKIVKEFQKNPSSSKDFVFTLTCEIVNEN